MVAKEGKGVDSQPTASCGNSKSLKRVAFCTLGCKVNQQETASLQQLFRQQGYSIEDFKNEAEVYIINTCTVTHLADHKSRQMIRRVATHYPQAVVAVVGCYAQIAPEEILAIPGVDLVVGTQQRNRLVELVVQVARMKQERDGNTTCDFDRLEQSGVAADPATIAAAIRGVGLNAVTPLLPGIVFEPLPMPYQRERSRAFLKIEDGCDQFCTYCIVPFARGPVRSLPPDQVEAQLQQLVQAGYKEVVLTGVHTSAYGRDLPEKIDLAGLLARLLDLPGEFRLRLSSIEAADITGELLQVIYSSPRFCRHLHLPLQSGSDQVLRQMHRPYDTAAYRTLFEQACSLMPGVAIAADVMVGFPGESEENFEEGYNFIASLPFRDLHVFKYSPRPGTAAADYPEQVAPVVKDQRSNRLLVLADKLAASFAGRFVGERLTVLVERRAPGLLGYWEGFSDNYLRVIFPAPEGDPKLRGQLLPVMVTETGEADTLVGEAEG